MKTDVLIVGGGLAGCATAFYLAREGVDVLLVERGQINGRASGANAGSIHVQIPNPEFQSLGEDWARGFAPVLPMMMAAAEIWRGLEAELGADLEVSLAGGLLVAETEAQMRGIEAKASIERAHGLGIEFLDRAALRSVAPYVSERMIGASFCAAEGKANPLKVAPAYAAAAGAAGARFLTETPLEALEAVPGGYLGHTPAGPIRAARVVNAAGAEAAAVGRMIGLDLAIQGVPIQLSVTEPAVPVMAHLLYSASGELTVKQARNGTFLIGGGWPARQRSDGTLAVDPHSLSANMAAAVDAVPMLGGLSLVRSWPAVVNGTEDWRPILGEAPGHPRFFLQLFPWMGFTAGPVAAMTIRNLILGWRPEFDLARISALG